MQVDGRGRPALVGRRRRRSGRRKGDNVDESKRIILEGDMDKSRADWR